MAADDCTATVRLQWPRMTQKSLICDKRLPVCPLYTILRRALRQHQVCRRKTRREPRPRAFSRRCTTTSFATLSGCLFLLPTRLSAASSLAQSKVGRLPFFFTPMGQRVKWGHLSPCTPFPFLLRSMASA